MKTRKKGKPGKPCGLVAHVGRAPGFYPVGRQFDSGLAHWGVLQIR
jgi:hypothetical protein